MGNSQTENIYTTEVLPQEPKPHIRLPSLGVLHLEDKLSECLSLKASRLTIGRARRLWEIEIHSERVYAKSHIFWHQGKKQ